MAEPTLHARPRGLVLRGRVWPGADQASIPSGVVIVDATGRIAALGPAGSVAAPPDLPEHGGTRSWIGPGLVDAHVHLLFGSSAEMVRGGVVAMRDLGAPTEQALRWRASPSGPMVAVAGPVVTAPGGYPTTTWGAGGVGVGVGMDDADAVTAHLAQAGVDVIKIALEPASGLPVPPLAVVGEVVEAAHDRGLAVTAHALTAATVERALAAGVDELAHVPVEPLPPALIDRLASVGVTVVSTMHALIGYPGSAVRENAAALAAAGVPLAYGTDLGNEGTRTGAEPRELELLAAAGLGRDGAVQAATSGSASVAGLRDRAGLGRLVVGEPAALVVLGGDPLDDPQRWRDPEVVVVGERRWIAAGGDGERNRAGSATPNLQTAGARPSTGGPDILDAGGLPDDHPAPPSQAKLGSARIPVTRFRTDLGVAVTIITASLLAGALVGVIWEMIASPAQVVVVDGDARFADPQQQRWISADAWLGILGTAAGLLVATLAVLRFRQHSVAMTVGLALGGLAGSYVASWVGRALGPPPIDPALADGTVVAGPLTVHAPAVLYAWPIAALALVMAFTAGFDRPPARSAPAWPW